jgi:FkbM family methyltransferase
MNINDYINTPIEIQKELLIFFKQTDRLVILDVGACEGEDSIRYSKFFPNSKVFSFEPLPANYLKIIENISLYRIKNIFPYNEALSDRIGTSTFFVSSGRPEGIDDKEDWDYGNKSSSLLEPAIEIKKHYNWLNFDNHIEVRTNTLKYFANTNQLNIVDFMHIDVQGAELMVLKGASDFLRKVKVIWMEVEEFELYKKQPIKKSIEEFMNLNNFYKYKDTVKGISGDQLYINKNYYQVESLLSKYINKVYQYIQEKTHYKKSYSQTGEDLIVKFILDSLKITKPRYLDIGAFHPQKINNTFLFYRKGAKGVCIEPDPFLLKRIQNKRHRDICLNVGIGINNEKYADFFILTSKTLNTFSKTEAEKYVSFGNQKIEKVIKIPLVEINKIVKDYFPHTLNFVSIDIEGLDELVIRSFDFNYIRPEVFCIETINYTEDNTEIKNSSIIDFFKNQGYMVFADTYINTIFVDSEKWKNR